MAYPELLHATEACTGQWLLQPVIHAGGLAEPRTIFCTRCTAQIQATTETKHAAIAENYAGLELRRLAAEGARLLRSQS